MIIEWVRNHKKLAILVGVGFLLLTILLLMFVSNFLNNPYPNEEKHHKDVITVSNIELLYDYFSDYTVGYITSALQAAVNANTSMKNGSPASENKEPAVTATNEDLYPFTKSGDYIITIKDDSFDYFEDEWGMWNTLIITTNQDQTFRIDVALGAHNRDNDVGYTKIIITKI